MSVFPRILCEGAAKDRGYAQGRAAKEAIQDNIETYRRVFLSGHGLDWQTALARVRSVISPLEEFDPDLYEELQGLAEGAGVDFLEILALNARSTITYSQEECTSLAFIGGIKNQQETVLGQNWDNMRRLKAVVLHVKEEGKPEILTLTEAGTLAKIGFNSAGIGLCVNGLSVAGHPVSHSVPIFVLIRKALQAMSLSEAMEVITKNPMDAPHNFKLASQQGGAFDVESLYEDLDIIAPTGPFLVHTNHILSRRLLIKDALLPELPNSAVRLWRARQLLAQMSGRSLGVQEMKTVLSDHFDLPNAICRHPRIQKDGLEGVTKCAVIMELENGRMHVSQGNPCEAPFETHQFDEKGTAS